MKKTNRGPVLPTQIQLPTNYWLSFEYEGKDLNWGWQQMQVARLPTTSDISVQTRIAIKKDYRSEWASTEPKA